MNFNHFHTNKDKERGIEEYFSQKYGLYIFPLGYMDIYSPKTGKELLLMDLDNFVTKSIKLEIQKQKLILDTQHNFLSIISGQFETIISDDNIINHNQEHKIQSIFEQLTTYLDFIAKELSEEKTTFIIGISFLGEYELLKKLFHIIKYLKEKYSHIIFVIGGSDFNKAKNKQFLDMVFDGGIDIVNIGGAREFIDFFSSLGGNDRFYRDENGKLHLIQEAGSEKLLPENILLSSSNIENVKPGKEIVTISYYNKMEKIFYCSIQGSGCNNNCFYCCNDVYDKRKKVSQDNIERSIEEFNYSIEGVSDDAIGVSINNPNPMQQVGVLSCFIKGIHLEKVKGIGFWGDFIGLSNSEKYKELESIIFKRNLSKYYYYYKFFSGCNT